MQSPANPQTLNRYSYCVNNPLKYIDPSGHEVAFPIIDAINGLLEMGMDIGDMNEAAIALEEEWEELQQNEPEYTQHMIDSEITFEVVDVDAFSQTITYYVDMPGEVNFTEPVRLCLVDKEWWSGSYWEMKLLDDARGLSTYPGFVKIRTDVTRSPESFTWLMAHELYHYWEQTRDGWTWYVAYTWECIWNLNEPNKRPSEKRANNYANEYFRY